MTPRLQAPVLSERKIAAKAMRCRYFPSGETRTRTGDTTIFSRVLYQLSYLAEPNRLALPAHAWSCASGSIGCEWSEEYQP